MKELWKIADKVTEKNRDESIKYVLSNSAVQWIVSQESYFDRDIANENNLWNYYVVSTDDFVYNPRISLSAPVWPIKRNHLSQWVMSPLYSVFRFHSGNLDFFESFFETNYWHKHLESIANFWARHDRMNITTDGFYSMLLPFPSLPEQQEIVSFLSVIVEKIEKLKTKKSLLEKYKKWVMQKIFSREIRFRNENGEEFGEWEDNELGKICKITIGEFVIKTKQNPDGKYPVYNGGRSFTGMYDEFNNEGNKVIISARGANAGFVNFQKQRYWAGNSCYSIDVLDKNTYNINYFFYFMKMFESNFTEKQQAANIPSVSKKDAENFKISTPCIQEQQKIASFLSELDKKIDTLDSEIGSVENWKKGLLQQMFI